MRNLILLIFSFFLAFPVYAQEEPTDDTDSTFVNLDELIIIGSRSKPRSTLDSSVPVDVLNISDDAKIIPQTNINQILNSILPSFTSTPQTIADGTDHLDPAQLRGLGPDQTLVLINGKRRHPSAHVNTNGSPGRGTVGTDLNAIPSFALSTIEVLRDGASAQYGSDAIAGVMNLQLKKDLGLSGQLSLGGNLSSESNDMTGGIDGENAKIDLNYGLGFGEKGGFINFTLSGEKRNSTSRASENTSNIFNAYNAIEWRAKQDNIILAEEWKNISTISNPNNLINLVQKYAQNVNYFDSSFLDQINQANSIDELQDILKKDFTNQELEYRNLTRKDFNMIVGQSEYKSTQFFYNTEIPFKNDILLYSFGGYSYKNGEAGGFYRKPNQSRTFTAHYPNGFLPKIGSSIQDISTALGLKFHLADWNFDLSHTLGKNIFDYEIRNTYNTSMRFNSPTTFDAGGYSFMQNTSNLDIYKDFDTFEGLTLSFGAEYRHENYKINAGDENSFASYGVDGQIVSPDAPYNDRPTDFFGSVLPQGSQVFSGFTPQSAISDGRSAVGIYAEAASDIYDWWFLDLALRFENYSDFGNTFNYKLSTRFKLTEDLNFRFAGSTGFRAPSIHQIYYTNVSTLYFNNELREVGTFNNKSNIAKLLGIPELKEEKSKSISTGFVYDWKDANLTLTADAYFIRIDDRVILTGSFSPFDNPSTPAESQVNTLFNNAGSEAAQFFANAIDTETKGLDIVLTHQSRIKKAKLNNTLALNLSHTQKVGGIHSSEILKDAGLEGNYFSENSRIYLEEAVPRFKTSLSHYLRISPFNFYLRNTYYGEVTGADVIDANNDGVVNPQEHQIFSGKLITDLSASYNFTKKIAFSLGVNNLFDIYPGKNIEGNQNSGQFIYTRSTSQFGLNGRYLFARIGFEL